MTGTHIPVMKPLLPRADKVAAYLRTVDESRWYSNNGQLNKDYERRLATLFGQQVTTASSGTSALTAAIIALDLPRDSLVACPSYTFAATPAAIMAAGHVPYFLDVDEYTHGMRAKDMQCYPLAFVFVAPFGIPLDMQACENFRMMSQRPVVVDAAASFDAHRTFAAPSPVPVVISTHCTKVFGTGEGGFVLSTDRDFHTRLRAVLNHGIDPDTREVACAGINGKLSEYHAAVGLAECDGWEKKRRKWLHVQDWYEDSSGYATPSHVVTVPDAGEVGKILLGKGIVARQCWYGVHNQPAFAHCPREALPVTEKLMRTQLALPKFIGMTRDEVDYIRESVKQCGLQ